MKRLTLSLVMFLALVAFLAPSAFSDTITFANSQYINGTGIGNTIHILSLQQPGGGTSETGSVIPTDTRLGDAQPNSNTYTSAQLTSLGLTATNLGIVFNPNETGAGAPNTVDVQSFSLDFYNGSGSLVGSALLTGALPINIVPISTGTGSSGWLMDYNEDPGGLLTQFFATSDWVLGATGSVLNTDNGPDNFYLVNLNVPPTPVPEPGAMMLFGSGLVGLVGWGRKKFRK